MSESKRIKTALVSVYHKEGLDEIITKLQDRKSTRLNSSHIEESRMPSSA